MFSYMDIVILDTFVGERGEQEQQCSPPNRTGNALG
jgi:hypothetical protein